MPRGVICRSVGGKIFARLAPISLPRALVTNRTAATAQDERPEVTRGAATRRRPTILLHRLRLHDHHVAGSQNTPGTEVLAKEPDKIIQIYDYSIEYSMRVTPIL